MRSKAETYDTSQTTQVALDRTASPSNQGHFSRSPPSHTYTESNSPLGAKATQEAKKFNKLLSKGAKAANEAIGGTGSDLLKKISNPINELMSSRPKNGLVGKLRLAGFGVASAVLGLLGIIDLARMVTQRSISKGISALLKIGAGIWSWKSFRGHKGWETVGALGAAALGIFGLDSVININRDTGPNAEAPGIISNALNTLTFGQGNKAVKSITRTLKNPLGLLNHGSNGKQYQGLQRRLSKPVMPTHQAQVPEVNIPQLK